MFNDGIYTIQSKEEVKAGMIIEIVNPECEFDFDCIESRFTPTSKMNTFEAELRIIEEDLSTYSFEKATNGGAYAFALAEVKTIL